MNMNGPDHSNKKVRIPSCNHIVFWQYAFKVLPLQQINFQSPILDTLEWCNTWHAPGYDENGINALQIV